MLALFKAPHPVLDSSSSSSASPDLARQTTLESRLPYLGKANSKYERIADTISPHQPPLPLGTNSIKTVGKSSSHDSASPITINVVSNIVFL